MYQSGVEKGSAPAMATQPHQHCEDHLIILQWRSCQRLREHYYSTTGFYQAKACLWASLDVVPKSTSVSRLRKSHWEMESTHCSTHCTYLWNCREILHKNNLHQLYTGCFTHACISLSFYSIRSFTCKSTLPDWGLQHTVETDAKRIIFQGLLFQTKRTSCCCCCCIFWMEWRVCKFLTGTKM